MKVLLVDRAVQDDVTIALNADQALVLFEMLARRSGSGGRISADHDGGRRVLDEIEAALEAELVEPFAADHQELVAQARARLAG